ncbi:MAG: beta-propeller domain-containing protein [Patescibacteria group bacterium]
MITQSHLDRGVALLASIAVVLGGVVLFIGLIQATPNDTSVTLAVPPKLAFGNMTAFTSADEFATYLETAKQYTNYFSGSSRAISEALPSSTDAGLPTKEGSAAGISRVSETNVQVQGIDEPDVVKTDGTNIFFSSDLLYYGVDDVIPLLEKTVTSETVAPDATEPSTGTGSSSVSPPITPQNKTRVLKAFPPEQIAQLASITDNGELLLDGKTLLVLAYNKISGYDVTSPANPKLLWSMDLKEQYLTARLWQNKLYLVTAVTPDYSTPCPLKPASLDGAEISIPCTRIYHPTVDLPVSSTYTAMVINPLTGKSERDISFVGSTDSTVIYMSPNALYVTYAIAQNYYKLLFDFIVTGTEGLIPADVTARMKKIQTYDISDESKMTELGTIMEAYMQKLSDEAQAKFSDDMSKKMDEYFSKIKRDLTHTGIVKIGLDTFAISKTGEIPGQLLNQFSIDEYQGNLRLATTITNIMGTSSQSANDIYILDSNLNKIGQIQDLGVTETVQSARFVGNRGYLVTFRQTDPFFVLDLTNPTAPKMTGELKLPGFSSYLHPLTDTLILGVGQDNWKTKLTLFDVTNAAKPVELATAPLTDDWSEAQTNHHAFLQDAKHKVFFVPGGQGGYIFSYDNNTLTQTKAVPDFAMKRALYINDYLYLISQTKVQVLNETNWEKVKEFELPV